MIRTLLLLSAVVVTAACGISSDVSRDLGARCDSRDDCDERCLLPTATESPNGFCTRQCVNNADCPSHSTCVDLEGGVCMFTCVDTAGCEFLGAGWACSSRDTRPDGEAMVCIGN